MVSMLAVSSVVAIALVVPRDDFGAISGLLPAAADDGAASQRSGLPGPRTGPEPQPC